MDGAVVGAGAKVRDSVVGVGASIGAGATLAAAVVGDGAQVGEGCRLLAGARVDVDEIVGDDVTRGPDGA